MCVYIYNVYIHVHAHATRLNVLLGCPVGKRKLPLNWATAQQPGFAHVLSAPLFFCAGNPKNLMAKERTTEALNVKCMPNSQGLVNVPFWEYWTSPYSSHYRPYT